MANSRSGNPKERWRQSKLAAERGKRRVQRKNKLYVSHKWEPEHRPIKNPYFKVKGKGRGTLLLELPKSLEIGNKTDRDEIVSLISRIKSAALYDKQKKVVLDFAKVETISPEVALLLVAEIQRCRAYCTGKTLLTGTYPKSPKVNELLIEIGFYDALGLKKPVLPKSYSSRTYVKIERKNRVTPSVIGELIDKFSQEVELSSNDKRRLQVALVECMDNVFQHAYPGDSKQPHLYREWWVVGYTDHEENLVSFSFLDQGIGIANTIKKRKHKRILDKLRWSDSRWIERAIRRPESRFSSKRRGHGLVKLKNFLDNTEMTGELKVISNNGDVTLMAGKASVLSDMAKPFQGTLIVWSLQGLLTKPAEKS